MTSPTFKQSLALALGPPLGAFTLKALAATWRVREAGAVVLSPTGSPAHSHIYAIWHESSLSAAYYGGYPIHALASRSFDGEIVSRLLTRLGWRESARGSSSRGGAAGLQDLRGYLAAGEHVLMTIDGPRGPRRVAKDGALKLARLSGCAVVPVAFASRPQPRFRSWDRMVLPPPLARCVYWFGPALRPEGGPRDGAPALARLQAAMERAGENADRFLDGRPALPEKGG